MGLASVFAGFVSLVDSLFPSFPVCFVSPPFASFFDDDPLAGFVSFDETFAPLPLFLSSLLLDFRLVSFDGRGGGPGKHASESRNKIVRKNPAAERISPSIAHPAGNARSLVRTFVTSETNQYAEFDGPSFSL